MAVVNRFDIYLLNMDEPASSQAKNTRPCIVVSPDEMNHNVSHMVVAPISSSRSNGYPTHVPIELLGKERVVVLDQLRVVDANRLVKKIGEVDAAARKRIAETLCEFFSE
jgi:mRNA interferase MazF